MSFSTAETILRSALKRLGGISLKMLYRKLKNGTEAKKVESGTARTELKLMQKEKRGNMFARIVGRLLNLPSLLKIQIDSARTIARAHTEERPVSTMLKGHANDAEESTSQTSTVCGNTVRVVGVTLDTKENVYNMTVDDNHNFSVNGGLICHNCDSMRYLVHTYRLAQPRRTEYISPFARR